MPMWRPVNPANPAPGVSKPADIGFASDVVFHFYSPLGTILVNVNNLNIKTIQVSSMNQAPVINFFVDFLYSSKGLAANSTSNSDASSDLVSGYQNHGINQTTKNGATFYSYIRSNHSYMILWDSATMATTSVRVVKISAVAAPIYINQFNLDVLCKNVAAKNQKFVCTTSTGFTVYDFNESGQLMKGSFISLPLTADHQLCLVDDEEIVFKVDTDTSVFATDMSGKETKRITGASGKLELSPTHEGCVIHGTFDSTPSFLTYSSKKFSSIFKERSSRIRVPGGPDVINIYYLDGIIYLTNPDGKIELNYIEQAGYYRDQRRPTDQLDYKPIRYEALVQKSNPSVLFLPVFVDTNNTAAFFIMEFTGSQGVFTPIITTDFRVTCSKVTYDSSLRSADFYFKNGIARNPNFGTEQEYLLIVKNPNFSEDFGEAVYTRSLGVLIATAILTSIALSVFGYFAIKNTKKLSNPAGKIEPANRGKAKDPSFVKKSNNRVS
jgi:hypothetical protein